MTYAPILSDTEHAVLIAALNLTARQVGVDVANAGLAAAEAGAGKLEAIRQLVAKINDSKVELEAVEAKDAAETA